MIATFTEARLEQDCGTWLCLKVDEPATARAFVLGKKNQSYDCQIKEHREKRSLDANAYYWRLCGELAQAVREKPEDIYRRHIKDIGNYAVYCMESRAVAEFAKLWGALLKPGSQSCPDVPRCWPTTDPATLTEERCRP